MPGRQGSGPLSGGGGGGGGGFRGGGGGGWGGGGGGFGGGGFRGGGWGGGYRGGGWGGGWRGPGWGGGWGWGWRPRFWGGWGLPLFFGPRFGGGGFGCGGLGCGLLLILVFLFVVAGGGIGSVFSGFGGYSANNGYYANSGGNTGGNSSGGGGGLASQPSSVQTQTAIDLNELHGALDSRIPTWQSQVVNNQEQHVSAGDAGMANDNNVKDVVYGKCGSAFFVFVVDKGAPTNAGSANGQGYAYTTSTSPATCHPTEYQVTDSEDDGGGWWFVYLQS